MQIDEESLSRLRHHVEAIWKATPRTPKDFDALAEHIYRRTCTTIGISTLKRIWGYIPTTHGTSYTTLSLLARYAGYADWDTFSARTAGEALSTTSGFGNDSLVACSLIPLDSVISLSWHPEKRCRLQKFGEPDLFRVLESANIKLLPGDTGHINSLQVGQPFSMTGCRRNSVLIGSYRGATREGITTIQVT